MNNIKEMLALTSDEHADIMAAMDAFPKFEQLMILIDGLSVNDTDVASFVTYVTNELSKTQPIPYLALDKNELQQFFWKLSLSIKNENVDLTLLSAYTTAKELIDIDFNVSIFDNEKYQGASTLCNSVFLIQSLQGCMRSLTREDAMKSVSAIVEKGHHLRSIYPVLVLDAMGCLRDKFDASQDFNDALSFLCEKFGLHYQMVNDIFSRKESVLPYAAFEKAINQAQPVVRVVQYPLIDKPLLSIETTGPLYPVIDEHILKMSKENNDTFVVKVREGTELYKRRKTRPISQFKQSHIDKMINGSPENIALNLFAYLVLKSHEYTTDRLALSIKECLGTIKYIDSTDAFASKMREACAMAIKNDAFIKPIKNMEVFHSALSEALSLYQGITLETLFKKPETDDAYFAKDTLPLAFVEHVLIPYIWEDRSIMDEHTITFISSLTLGGTFQNMNLSSSATGEKIDLKALENVMQELSRLSTQIIPRRGWSSIFSFTVDEPTQLYKFVAKLARQDINERTLGLRLIFISIKLKDTSCVEANNLIHAILNDQPTKNYFEKHGMSDILRSFKIEQQSHSVKRNNTTYSK